MKLRNETSDAKLCGGFYTPASLVSFCWSQIAVRQGGRTGLSVLEPSAGDGAFIRGIRPGPADGLVDDVLAVELNELEARKAGDALDASGVSGSVVAASAIQWAAETSELFDVVVGNPPFVRYQFVSKADQVATARLGNRLGLEFAGVGNLWIPILVGALSRLRPGGAFAVVIPTECFTGVSAGIARDWLIRNASDLTFDLFPPDSFPGVLQEVTILSGKRTLGTQRSLAHIKIVEHDTSGQVRSWMGDIPHGKPNWMELLLEPSAHNALHAALNLPHVHQLGSVARLEVSIVTGANDYFCVSDATLAEHGLELWARPLLPRIRHAPGLVFGPDDQQAIRSSDGKAWLLDFSGDAPSPLEFPGPSAYIRAGEEHALDARYKCRIRTPWYRVPSIRAGRLLMSKRSHHYPRLVVNEAGSLTTDTIYRGRVLETFLGVDEYDVAAAFHGSLTLLTSELYGRSFGGGVLELVPGELSRLALPVKPGLRAYMPKLELVARSGDPDDLIHATDAALVSSGLLPHELVAPLSEARRSLQLRRLDRNSADRATLPLAA